MYLKSIEVHGFKSFAHKLVFQFKDGITGIVGPNGSGKSNVADAVRWVLGEQSAKQLRGTKMEDIIFAGTETRKALGFAYVAITFDNSDKTLPIEYDEVTVARRVYRSGESEYLINGAACLLKDVKEMFFDTGIGKEGYSIIGQGQIDKILSGKPEDRRELFDEAAGIVKYKRRKAATQKNLDAERQNLVRVNDILTELEIQIGPLKKQSEKARQYLDLREKLKSKDIHIYILEYDRLNSEMESMSSKQEIAGKDLSAAAEKYSESRSALDEMGSLIEDYEKEADEKNRTINDNRVKSEQLAGEVKLYEQQIETSKQNEEQFAERMSKLSLQSEEAKKELSEFIRQKKTTEEASAECDGKKIDAEEKINSIFREIHYIEELIDKNNQNIINAMNDTAKIKADQTKYETMLEQSSIKKAEMNQNLFRLKADMDSAKENYTQAQQKVEKLNSEIEERNNNIKSLKFSINDNERKRRATEDRKQETQRRFHKYSSQINTLKNISERYEGYGQSIKKVMEKKSGETGIIGVVADIISVGKKYETAVETSLGGNIQNIVTDNDDTARKMIEYLKKNRLGRATFLPLSSIVSDAPYDEKLSDEKGVLGPVSDFVDTKPEYREVIKYLLGRFILVDNVDNALALASKYNRTLRIVTLEGEFLNVGGSISGGAFRNSGNLLGRKREIEELESKLSDVKKEIAEINSDAGSIMKENEKLLEEVMLLEEKNHNTQLELGKLQLQYMQAKEQHSKCMEEYETAKNGSAEIEAQKLQLTKALDEAKQRLSDNDDSSSKFKHENDDLLEKLELLKTDRSKMHDVINQLSIDRIALTGKDNHLQENIDRINLQISRIEEEQKIITESKADAKNGVSEKEQAIKSVKKAIESLEEETRQLTLSVADTVKKREALIEKQKTALKEREALADRRGELEKEQIRLQNQSEKLQASFTSLNQYMWNEYELTYRGALELRTDEEFSYNSLKQETQELRHKIKSLGDVNVNSIDEYNSVSERYTTMKKQHDDIVTSEERLLNFIEELEDKMRKQFEEKFVQIKEQYNIVFRELFGGGKGLLELTEDEDVLDAGIQIIAQPPGKTLKSMSMLSGGEKALSAIAILFAIQNLKPSPFCLLDEIEAALDDSNVKRFAKYLNKLKSKTQYIVITHRQGTMAAADTLYGITMQEKGVSTLVSVDLVEQQLEKEGNYDGGKKGILQQA